MADLANRDRVTQDPHGSADPVRWARACEIFHAALEQPVDQREAFVTSVCAADPLLRQEVITLVTSDGLAWDFIEQPAAALLATTRRSASALRQSMNGAPFAP